MNHQEELRQHLHRELDRARTRRRSTRIAALVAVILLASVPILIGPSTPGRSVTPQQIARAYEQRAANEQEPSAERAAPPRQAAVAESPPTESKPDIPGLRVMSTDPQLALSRLSVIRSTPARAVRTINDDELISVLAAAGRPAGIVRSGADVRLISLSPADNGNRMP